MTPNSASETLLELLALARCYTPSLTPRVPPRQFSSLATRPFGGPLPPVMAEIIQPLREEDSAVYEKLVSFVARQGNLEEEVYYAHRVGMYAAGAAEGYARLEKVLLSLKDLPAARDRMRAHLLWHMNLPRGPSHIEHRKFLDRLEATGNPDIKAAVSEARKVTAELERLEKNQAVRFEKERVAQATFKEAKKQNPKLGEPLSFADPDRADSALRGSPFRHIRLTATPIEPEPRLTPTIAHPRMGQIQGIIPAGAGTDVLWTDGEFSDGTLYVMKEKGKPKRVFRIGGLRSRFTSVVFDGKYVWAAGDRDRLPPVLIVLDLNTERVISVTVRHGLPAGKKEMVPQTQRQIGYRLTALEPGRVCIAGYFGQTWVAIGTFDPRSGPTVKVIHEAKDVEEKQPDQWKKTAVAFVPGPMNTLRGKPDVDGKSGVRVLIMRLGLTFSLRGHPLLIDPEAGTARVMEQPLPGVTSYSVCGTGSSVYVPWGMGYQDGIRKESRLLRIDYPGQVTDLGTLPNAGNKFAIHFDGKHLHIARIARELHNWEAFVPAKERWWPAGDPSDWWTFDPDRKTLTKVATDFHRVKWIGSSSHYGLVVGLDCGVETLVCTVSFNK